MSSDYAYVGLFLLIGIGFVVVTMWFSWALRPSKPGEEKLSTYECGEPAIGSAWVQFNFRYYTFALLFVVFDLETIFLYPWAVVFKSLGLFAFIEMMIFLAILTIGLVYAWKKGALEWV